MSKRLFALLLAAALVLSIGTAQATAGEMSGTEQTEQGADAPVPAPDAADAAEEDAPAGEPGEDDGTDEDDALVGDNNENGGTADESGGNDKDGETAGKTGEDDGDDGETVPAADNSLPSNDEPQTTEDGPATVTVLFEGAEHITSLTANGADVLPDAQAGTPIVLSADSEGRVSLGMELEDGYTAGADENSYDSVRFDGGMVEIRDDGDGKAVVQITALPQVIANSASGFTVIFEGVEQIDSVTNADNGTVYDFNGPVELDPVDADGAALQINVKDGYYVQETDECEFERYYYPSKEGPSVEAFLLRDEDGDGTVTVHILKLVKVTLVDEGKYVTQVTDSIRSYYDSFLTDSYKLKQNGRLLLRARACALDVVGGHVSGEFYSVDDTTGELSVNYDVVPDGAETMTVTTKPGDEAQMPKPIHIQYEGMTGKIKSSVNYVLPGDVFSVELEDGYMISVEGSISLGTDRWGYTVTANMDATFITVTVQAVWKNARLIATIPEAVEPSDIYGMSEDLGRVYVRHGGTMENGKGWFLLKNGYEVGPGVEGGSVTRKLVAYNEETRSIHTYYKVDAAADTVTVPIVKARPYRWVGVQAYDAPDYICFIGSELVSGWQYESESAEADSEVFLPALDELTATLGSGYELVAVSGCALRWEKDTGGKIIYHILPDAAGDTEVEVRVIEAGQQEPVLKVGTDADTGVQTDAAAESILEAAIDAFAGGSTPAGMSQDTAEKLKAALEEADAVTVPELSAVLSVKREADTAAFPGAAAVYEIGIVLSVNGEEVGSLTELAQPISISLPLPPETGRIVYLVRSHDGKQEKLASTVKDNAISFVTDRFSEFAIMSNSDLAEATVDPIPDQTWTGSELTPKVRVTIIGRTGEETLKEGTDYKLTYKDNVEAGTATVTIVGMGDFDGSSATVTFRILETETETTTPPTDPGGTTDDPGGTTDDPGGTTDDPGGTTDTPATGDETPLTLYT